MSEFYSMYSKLKEVYVRKHGNAKFTKIESKVLSSSKLNSLYERAAQFGMAPSGADFSATIHSIGYFMFSGKETCAMADLIAMLNWHETYNAQYVICSDYDLVKKAASSLRRYQISF